MHLFFVLMTFVMALGISLYAVPVVIRIANTLKMYDQPNSRSSATIAVPTLGGIAIYLSFSVSASIGVNGYIFPGLTSIFVALLLMFFVGIKDDILSISPYKKITAQLITAAILIFYAKIRFTNLHGFLGIGELGPLQGVILTAFVMIVFINAYNLIDGIDGLAAGQSIFAAAIFGCWFYISGHFEYAILSFALIGALLGFFFYNVYGTKNKIFMGDTGSLVLGTLISILVIKFNELNIDQTAPLSIASAPAVSFAILIYPLFDTLRVFMIRIMNKKSPFTPDKNHLHHRLLALGFSHKKATYTIIIFNILFIIPVFALQNIGIIKLMAFNFLLCALLFTLPAIVIQKKKLIRENDPHQQIIFPSTTSPILSHINFIEPESDLKVISIDIKKNNLSKISFW
jgi:UDP-N-acetylmuramyl pentapeptide phosphotransferase/UDP-N-acetylglucosamine-1-phosphate transferase